MTLCRHRHRHFPITNDFSSSLSLFFHHFTIKNGPFKGILGINTEEITFIFGKITTSNGFMTQNSHFLEKSQLLTVL